MADENDVRVTIKDAVATLMARYGYDRNDVFALVEEGIHEDEQERESA